MRERQRVDSMLRDERERADFMEKAMKNTFVVPALEQAFIKLSQFTAEAFAEPMAR